MFWEHESWQMVETAEIPAVLDLIRRGLSDREEVSALNLFAVQGARVRRLDFYPDRWLYELDVPAPERFREDGSWQLYAVLSVRSGDAACAPHRRIDAEKGEASPHAVLIDLTEAFLHRLDEHEVAEGGRKLWDVESLSGKEFDDSRLDFYWSFCMRFHGRSFFSLARRLQSRPVSAEEFIGLVEKSSLEPANSSAAWVERLRVAGEVDFKKLGRNARVRIRFVEFADAVVLDDWRSGVSVAMSHCCFNKHLHAKNCEIDGDLSIQHSLIAGGLNADGAGIGGAGVFSGLRALNGVSMMYARIGGIANFSLAQIGANLNISSARIGQVALGGAHIAQDLDATYANLTMGIWAGPEVVSGQASRCRIDGDVVLSGARLGSDATFDGTRISGGFKMYTGSLGRLSMCVYPTISADGAVGGIYAEVGYLRIVDVTGIKSMVLSGIKVARRTEGISSLYLRNIRCSGSIHFHWGKGELNEFNEILDGRLASFRSDEEARGRFKATCLNKLESFKQSFHAEIKDGDLEMQHVAIGGSLDLTNLQVPNGDILLNDVKVGTDLYALRSLLRGNEFEDGLQNAGGESFALKATARKLDLDNAKIGGDAYLEGV